MTSYVEIKEKDYANRVPLHESNTHIAATASFSPSGSWAEIVPVSAFSTVTSGGEVGIAREIIVSNVH